MLNKKLEKEVDKLIQKFYLPKQSNSPTTRRLSKLVFTSKNSSFYLSDPIYLNTPFLDYPTDETNTCRLLSKLKMYQERYHKFGAIKIVDVVSEKYKKRPMYVFTENDLIQEIYFPQSPSDLIKRFQVFQLTEKEYLEDKGQTLQGYFLETYIISELNRNKLWKCPHCGMQNNLSICIENDSISESFRDAICLNCKSYFEIKTKNDSFFRNKIYKKKLIHGGDYISINILLHQKKNVYIIIFNRDTGDIYSGKIIDCYLRENEKFLYSMQEGGNMDFGYPSSYVRVDDFANVVKLKPADVYITIEKSDEISKVVIDKLLLLN
jgi:hypothetical protein